MYMYKLPIKKFSRMDHIGVQLIIDIIYYVN